MATIKGLWKFYDVLTRPTVEIDENVSFEFSLRYPFGGVTYDAIGKGDRIYTARAASTNTNWGLNYHYTVYFVDLPNETPASSMKGVYNGSEEQWLVDSEGEYQVIDFGATGQEVSDAFYEWFTANATLVTASIRYNGSTIANLFTGDTATLKCKGTKMETDVVVKVGEPSSGGSAEIVLQEKTATENGEVTPDEGYDGLSKVTVKLPSYSWLVEVI